MFGKLKKVFGGEPRQSLGSLGAVMHRFGKGGEFNPEQQLTGITYKAINKIGQTLSVYEPIVSVNGRNFETHPLYPLHANPNPRWSGTDFIHLYGMVLEIYGESFWYIVKGESTGKAKELWMLNPSQMEIKTNNGEIIGYVLHKGTGHQVPLEVEEVIHDKYPNPFNEWRGLSVLERAAVYVGTEITTSNFTLNYMRNNASPSGIVSTPDMEPEAFKSFVSQWREGYEGPENAGKTAFIRGGEANFQAVGATLKDVDAKVVRQMSKDDVLMMFDMPKPLIGMTDDEGFGRGNLETLKQIYAESKLEPLMRRLDSVYEELLIKGNLGRGGESVSHESPIPEDKEFRHKQHKDLVNVALTVNEVRAHMGLDEIPGGDELDPGNKPQTREESLKVVKKAEPTKKQLDEEREEFRQNIENTSEAYAKDAKRIVSEFASEQEQRILGKIDASEKSFEEWLFTIKEESEKMGEELSPLMIELMEEQVKEASNFITGELVTVTNEQREIRKQQIIRVAGAYNEDTLRALENTLAEGASQGESLAKMKKRVEEVYVDAKGYRAERIARTESLRTSNASAEFVYKESGFSKVQWFANPGACEFCQAMDRQTKEIGSNYHSVGSVVEGVEGGKMNLDYDDIEHPPLHPSCRCSLVPA